MRAYGWARVVDFTSPLPAEQHESLSSWQPGVGAGGWVGVGSRSTDWLSSQDEMHLPKERVALVKLD